MSTNLYWRPNQPVKKYNAGPDAGLKWALEKRYGLGVNINMTDNHLEYLRGLADADVKGAQDLIDAIEKYDKIQVFTE